MNAVELTEKKRLQRTLFHREQHRAPKRHIMDTPWRTYFGHQFMMGRHIGYRHIRASPENLQPCAKILGEQVLSGLFPDIDESW